MILFDNILFLAVAVMLVFYLFKLEIRESKQFNYAFAGVLGLLGALELILGIKFDSMLFSIFGVFELILGYFFYRKAQRL